MVINAKRGEFFQVLTIISKFPLLFRLVRNMQVKIALNNKIILPITARTDGTQATYKLTQFSITRENKPFAESRFLKTFSSTFYLCSDCKSYDWTQQSAAVQGCITSFKQSCNKSPRLKDVFQTFYCKIQISSTLL